MRASPFHRHPLLTVHGRRKDFHLRAGWIEPCLPLPSLLGSWHTSLRDGRQKCVFPMISGATPASNSLVCLNLSKTRSSTDQRQWIHIGFPLPSSLPPAPPHQIHRSLPDYQPIKHQQMQANGNRQNCSEKEDGHVGICSRGRSAVPSQQHTMR